MITAIMIHRFEVNLRVYHRKKEEIEVIDARSEEGVIFELDLSVINCYHFDS